MKMQFESIEKHLNKMIEENVSVYGFDLTRQELFIRSRKFRNRLRQEKDIDTYKMDLSKAKLINFESSHTTYMLYYISFCEKRILDLYEIEKKFKKDDPKKMFKLYLFKERLLAGRRKRNTYCRGSW